MSLTETPETWYAPAERFPFRTHPVVYRDSGGGAEAVLLIHGFPTCSWDWSALWPRMVERYGRVIAPDMLGFGRSAKPRGHRYDLLEQTDLHVELLQSLGVQRIRVLAHDYGVSVAQELLARALEDRLPFALDGVALLNGGLFPETHRQTRMQKLVHSPLGGVIVRFSTQKAFNRSFSLVFGPQTQPSEFELDHFWALLQHGGGHHQLHRLIRYIDDRREHRARWTDALQRAPCPLRLINGPADPVSGAHMAARYRELVPNADIVSLPDIGHYPQVEDPDGVWAALVAAWPALR